MEVKPTNTWQRRPFTPGGFPGRETKEERLVKENKISKMAARRDSLDYARLRWEALKVLDAESEVLARAERLFIWANKVV